MSIGAPVPHKPKYRKQFGSRNGAATYWDHSSTAFPLASSRDFLYREQIRVQICLATQTECDQVAEHVVKFQDKYKKQ